MHQKHSPKSLSFFESFLELNKNDLQKKTFPEKIRHSANICGFSICASWSDMWSTRFSICDILLLSIPRLSAWLFHRFAKQFLYSYVDIPEEEVEVEEEVEEASKRAPITRWIFGIPLLILAGIQICLSVLLALIFSPITLIVHGLYPYCENSEDMKKAADRRRFIFNPSTSILLLLLSLLISSVIQYCNSNGFVFVDAAMPLLMVQCIFTGFAVLTLIGAAAGALHSLIQKGDPSGTLEYLSELITWCSDHKLLTFLLIILSILSIAAVTTLTVGIFVDPVTFNFLQPLFDFTTQHLKEAFQNLGHLPGLEFLSTLSETLIETIGEAVSILTLYLAAIFVPDNLRRFLTVFTTNRTETKSDNNLKFFQIDPPCSIKVTQKVGSEDQTFLSIDEGEELIALAYSHPPLQGVHSLKVKNKNGKEGLVSHYTTDINVNILCPPGLTPKK